jgi:putative ABC transport system permease protein
VGVVAVAGLRRRWLGLTVLTLALALVGTVVLASIAGSRRGRGALDEFLDFNRPGTVEAYVNPELPLDDQVSIMERLVDAAAPAPGTIESQVIVAMPGPHGLDGEGTDYAVAEAFITDDPLTTVKRNLVVDGRLPLAAGEVAISEKVRERRGVDVGDTLTVALFRPEDVDQVGNGTAPEPRELVDLTVGAVIREPLDLASSPQAQPGTIFAADEAHLVMEPTFFEEHGRDSASYGLATSIDAPADQVHELTDALQAEGGDNVLVNPSGSEDLAKVEPIGDAIDLEANALLAFAAVVLVFGLVLLGAALHRTSREDPDDQVTLRGLGVTSRQLATITLVRGGLVTLVATALAVLGAALASGLFPIGLAADAEIDPGIQLDLPVLLIGAPLFALLVLGRLVLGVIGERRRQRRTTPAASLPLTPGALGARLALGTLGPGSRVALATVVVGLVAVVGAATFAASLARLVDSPERQGWVWDAVVGNYSSQESADEGAAALAANPDVDRYAPYQWSTFTLDGESTVLAMFDPGDDDLVPVVLDGRAPQSADEIALGRGALDELDKALGDTVELAATGAPTSMRVVGEIVAPATISTAMDLDSGGSMTFDAARAAFGDQAPTVFPSALLVRFRDDVDPDEGFARLREDFPGTVLGPMQPLDVHDLERVRSLPYLLAGLLGTIALVSVALTLAAATRRRRRDVAVLRSIGFARSQLRRLLAGESTTFLALALVVGIPIGVVAGRVAWRLAAGGLGSEVGPFVPLTAIVAATLALLVLVNAYGQWLAHLAGRRRPGEDLRTE